MAVIQVTQQAERTVQLLYMKVINIREFEKKSR